MTDLLAALLDACERTPDAPAITLGRTRLRYRDLRDRVLGIAAGLAAEGLEPGDRVLFSVRPGPQGICLALGIVAAGGTVVFADPGAGEALFAARARLAAPRWVAAESLLYAASARPLRALARRRGIDLPDYGTVVPDARHIHAGSRIWGEPRGSIPLRRLLRHPPEAVGSLSSSKGPDAVTSARFDELRERGAGAEALIIFTSGTTDRPKAVVHSRESLGAGLQDFARHAAFVPGERVLTDQLMVGIPALIGGAHWVMPPPGLDPGASPERFARLLPDADVLFAVPAALDAMLRAGVRSEGLRMLMLGGAPVLRPLLERARQRMPRTRILAIYGMTELLPVAIADGDEKLAFEGAGDLVGELMPSVTAELDDGELVVSGDGLALGYLGEPPLARLRTGDLARLDADRLVLAGRAKDMFIRGSTNVYPGLYEPVIAGLPGVADAALAGVPDEIGDDRLVLAIVPGNGFDADAVRRSLPGLIDAAVLPDRIVTVESLPRSGRSRKLDRAALAERLAGTLT